MLILASGSEIRATLLRNAQIPFTTALPRVDEENYRAALAAEGASAHDQADALAELKAAKIAAKSAGLVLGCDQILALGDRIFAKPTSIDDARAHLRALSGQTHKLHSAAVLYEDGKPVWRHVGLARLTMRALSDAYIDDYLARNWDSIRHAVGCYKLEEEGVRLFTAIEGSHFTILGLPLLELIAYLTRRGTLPA